MKKHPRECLKTSFANHGRVAGSGILYDKYDDESGREVYNSYYRAAKIKQREEKAKEEHENAPVTVYFIDKEKDDV